MSEENKILWDDVIPDKLIIPGRSPHRVEPHGEDLVLERVPGAKYAIYKVDYKRSKLFPEVLRTSTSELGKK